MQDAQTELRPAPLPLRNDTILGVCEALSEDFGFNANYLRVAFCVSLYFNPMAVIGVYLTLGLAVALSRWLAPVQRDGAAPRLAVEDETPQNDGIADAQSLPLAA